MGGVLGGVEMNGLLPATSAAPEVDLLRHRCRPQLHRYRDGRETRSVIDMSSYREFRHLAADPAVAVVYARMADMQDATRNASRPDALRRPTVAYRLLRWVRRLSPGGRALRLRSAAL